MWSITVKGASVGDLSGVSLVEVYVKSSDIDGEPDCLWMRPTERFQQDANDGQNLLRSLLLLTAKNPKSEKEQTHSIQFFKPLLGNQEYVDFFKRGLTDIEVKFPLKSNQLGILTSWKSPLQSFHHAINQVSQKTQVNTKHLMLVEYLLAIVGEFYSSKNSTSCS